MEAINPTCVLTLAENAAREMKAAPLVWLGGGACLPEVPAYGDPVWFCQGVECGWWQDHHDALALDSYGQWAPPCVLFAHQCSLRDYRLVALGEMYCAG